MPDSASAMSGGNPPVETEVVVTQRTRQGCCLGRLVSALMLVLVLFIVIAIAAAPYSVQGEMMAPTLREGQAVLVHTDHLFGLNLLPNRGNIVFYHPNDNPAQTIVGRVIAIPGDTITVTANSVILNGKPLSERYIAPVPAGEVENPTTFPMTTLRGNQYFIMGDNRTSSKDSRTFGPVTSSEILSTVWLVIG